MGWGFLGRAFDGFWRPWRLPLGAQGEGQTAVGWDHFQGAKHRTK